MLWMIDNQKGRRNVSDYDKGLLAMRRQDLLRPMAAKAEEDGHKKGGQTAGRGRPKTDDSSSAKLPKSNRIDTRREAAKEAGIGERTLDAVKLIKDAGGEGAVVRVNQDRVSESELADAPGNLRHLLGRVGARVPGVGDQVGGG